MNLVNGGASSSCAIDLLADVLEDSSDNGVSNPVTNDSSQSQKQKKSYTLIDITEKPEPEQETTGSFDIHSYRKSLKFIREVSGSCPDDDGDGGEEEEQVFGTSSDNHYAESRASFAPERKASWKSKTLSAPPPQQATAKHSSVDTMFGMRIANPMISSRTVEQLMQGRKFVSIAQAKQMKADKEPSVDWVVVGAIVNKSQPRTSKSGSSYTVWRISDLKSSLLTISIFLFGTAYSTHWKHALGTVVGILNPKLMAGREGYSDNEASLSVNQSDKLLVVGTAKDYALCQARKKDGSPCTAFVNAHDSKVCVHHLASEYKKTARNLVSPSTSRINLQNKILGKNEIFYGGKSYVKTPAKPSPKQLAHDKLVLSRLSPAAGSGCGTGSKASSSGQAVGFAGAFRKQVTANTLRNTQATKDNDILERLSATSGSSVKTAASEIPKWMNNKTDDDDKKPERSSRIEENTPSFVMKKRIQSNSQKIMARNSDKGSPSSSSVLKEQNPSSINDAGSGVQKQNRKSTTDPFYLEITENVSPKQKNCKILKKEDRKSTISNDSASEIHSGVKKKAMSSDINPSKSYCKTESTSPDITQRLSTSTSEQRDLTQENTPSFVMRKRTRSEGEDKGKDKPSHKPDSPAVRKKDVNTTGKSSVELMTTASKKAAYYLKVEEERNSKVPPGEVLSLDHLSNSSDMQKACIGVNSADSSSKPVLHPRKQAARAKAAQIIKKVGPLPKDSNKSVAAVKRKLEDNSEKESEKERVSQLEKFRRLMGVSSKHTTLIEARDLEAEAEYFNNLEKKEQLEEKMLTTYKVPCKAVRCPQCKYLALSASEYCRSQGHRVYVVETCKRFFKCEDCGNRTISLNLVPTQACGRCNGSRWKRTTMISERRGPALTTPLCLRGGEEVFLGHETAGNINLLVPED